VWFWGCGGDPIPLLTDTRNLTFFHDPVSISEQPAKLQGVLFSSHAIKRARVVGSISGGITGTDRSRDPSDGVWTSAPLRRCTGSLRALSELLIIHVRGGGASSYCSLMDGIGPLP
jgi:hypothetical protein